MSYLYDKFEQWFDLWDTTGDPELRRLGAIIWSVARYGKPAYNETPETITITWNKETASYKVSKPNWEGGEVVPVEDAAEVVGGIPHGFGIWIDGKFQRVDIGALGKVITDLQEWKEGAMKVMARTDHQKIANVLGLKVGTDVTTDALLKPIHDLQLTVAYRLAFLASIKKALLKLSKECGKPTTGSLKAAHDEQRETLDALAEGLKEMADGIE